MLRKRDISFKGRTKQKVQPASVHIRTTAGTSQSLNNLLQQVYGTPNHPSSFTSASKIQRVLGEKYNKRTNLNQVQEWLNDQRTYSLHKRAVHKFPRNPIIAGDIDEQWQGDLLFLPDLRVYNDNIECALVCIDIVSRYAWVEPLRNKSGESTTEGMRNILKRAHPRKPQKLQTDDGGEFFNKHFQNLMKNNSIILFSVKSDTKAAIAERFIRTIKEKIYRFLDHQPGNNRYLDNLQDLVASYNSTYHKSIQMVPDQVDETTLGRVLHNLYSYIWTDKTITKPPLFKINDRVRISSVRHVFQKGYKGKWKEEVFIIEKNQYGFPHHLYTLKDWNGRIINGSFYENELQKVNVDDDSLFIVEQILDKRQRRGHEKEYLIRWSGYSQEFDSWEPESNITSTK
jgi:hypothetical protein